MSAIFFIIVVAVVVLLLLLPYSFFIIVVVGGGGDICYAIMMYVFPQSTGMHVTLCVTWIVHVGKKCNILFHLGMDHVSSRSTSPRHQSADFSLHPLIAGVCWNPTLQSQVHSRAKQPLCQVTTKSNKKRSSIESPTLKY